jgi:GT2 family glycosyltransferase
MSRAPNFSIVIPTHNRLDFLKQAVNSIWAQTVDDYEIIIVNDGSTDGTEEWLDAQRKRVRTFTQANRGPGAARNLGAQHARGEYVAFLDSDDLWFPWTLDTFARAIQEHRRPQIVGGAFVEFTDETEVLAVRKEPYQSSWFIDYLASARFPYYVGSGAGVLHRDVFAAATGFVEDRLNAEDHDLILRMGTLPGFVRILAPLTLAWRRHRVSETADFAKSVSGAMRLLAREKSGVYPGGSERSRERYAILARHTRPTALACLQNGEFKQGWQLYRFTCSWNIVLGHWKYVLAFPILAVLSLLSRRIAREPPTT